MTTIKIHKCDGEIYGITTVGHADYDDEGLDIVCSAISSAVMMVHVYLDDVLKINFETEIDPTIALIAIKVNPKDKKSIVLAKPIFETFCLHLYNLSEDYRENIEIMEV